MSNPSIPPASPLPSNTPMSGIEDRPHNPPDDREEVYYEGSPMLRSKVFQAGLSIVIGIVFIAVPILARMYHYHLHWVVNVIVMLIGLALIIMPIVFAKSIRYRITNYRIDFERGILTKRIDTLELWHVEDISFRQGLFDRMLGVGSILIDSSDRTTPKLELHGVPRPRPVFEALKQRVIAVKRQRGVVKMDVGDLNVHPNA